VTHDGLRRLAEHQRLLSSDCGKNLLSNRSLSFRLGVHLPKLMAAILSDMTLRSRAALCQMPTWSKI